MSKAKQENYDLFLKKFMEETGKDEQHVRQLMSKLKRAENKLYRLYHGENNTGTDVDMMIRKSDMRVHVMATMLPYKSIETNFNGDPRGSVIRFTFKKTGWINTLGSDVAIDW